MQSSGLNQQVNFTAFFQPENSHGCRSDAYLEIDTAEYHELQLVKIADDALDDALQYVSGAGLGQVLAREDNVL